MILDPFLHLANGELLYYQFALSFEKRRAEVWLRGGRGHAFGGISMGYFVEPRSELFDWLTHPDRLGNNPKRLVSCLTYEDLPRYLPVE